MQASTEARSLTITSGDDAVTLDNILVGYVWVLGGQSSMEHPLARVENGQLEIVTAHYPNIRILTVPYSEGPDSEAGFPRLMEWSGWFGRHFRKGYWDPCSPEVARGRDQIDRTTLILTSHMVTEPVAYRYAWGRSPMGSAEAYHLTDIPLATQRSDDWPLEATPLGVFEDGPPAQLNGGQRNQLLQALRNIDLRRRAAEAESFLQEHAGLLQESR